MNRPRYSPRLTGAGKQFMKQALDKDLVRVILNPVLRNKIKAKFDCTDEDITKALREGLVEFGDQFKKMLAKQRAEMVPPPEDNDD